MSGSGTSAPDRSAPDRSGPNWAAFLPADETVLWQGRPDPSLSLAPVSKIVFILGGLAGVMGLGIVVALAGIGAPGQILTLAVLGTLAVIALLAWLIARANAARRRRLRYAVTARRALVHDSAVPKIVTAITPWDPDRTQLRQKPYRRLVIGLSPLRFSMESGGTQTTAQEQTFDVLPDPEVPLSLLQDAARANAPNKPDGQIWSATIEILRQEDG